MEKILGVDLGTNSIGLTLRENDRFSWYGVYTFKKGVGEGKSGEFSFASERTKHRSSRRTHNARRYRKWETLKVLIINGYCPLSLEELNNWKYYKKGIGRLFPVNNKLFNQWFKLDFNNDGTPDYISPYQLRRELITKKLDLTQKENKYKIGRALYHIAQRRGFKSSRKQGKNEKSTVYKGSSDTTATPYDKYRDELEKSHTLGAYFAKLENEGIRIRNRYTLRSDYYKEIEKILELQEIKDETFNKNILQAIFFQRPLRSQKGLIGKCTMELGKVRCPISHPKFEEYRAWSFVNNIKYRIDNEDNFQPIPLDLKSQIISEKLFLKKNKVDFIQVRKFICRGKRKNWNLNYSTRMDKVAISTCSVSSYLQEAFGENWKNIIIQSNKIKKNGNGNEDYVKYSIEDIWHIIFSFEDEEFFEEFLFKDLNLNNNQIAILKKLWNNFPIGYAKLSLKAINNILPFLKQGLIYSEAVFLAKIPDIIGKQLFEDNKENIIKIIKKIIVQNRYEKTIVNITNSLIANYKVLDYEDLFAYKDFTYSLHKDDYNDILKNTISFFGKKRWNKKEKSKQNQILKDVESKYLEFFHDKNRDYIKQPKLIKGIYTFLIDKFNLKNTDLKKLYHPSMIDIYPSKENQKFLKSPKTRAFKNPMAYKTLHKLRYVINYLIGQDIINKETKIVLEIARELNDKNKRAAIKDYQNKREKENREYATAISELIQDPHFSGNANPNNKNDIDKIRLWVEQIENNEEIVPKILATKDEIKKYRLWKEQNSICMYTGRLINLTDLFNQNTIDFEHTIPRSKSFDNSLANLTVCYADYNRDIKKNQIPTILPNYNKNSHGFQPIKSRLEKWESKIESLEKKIETQKLNSKTAQDKDVKDTAIRTRHYLQMELTYWVNKVDRFTREDIPSGFKNSQLVDTQLISKYALHYLKTVFNQVEVIKGSTTADFRKIYGIQPKHEKKDRISHAHHVIDAAVLTLLPTNAKRKEILESYYKAKENKIDYHTVPFEGFKNSLLDRIKQEILVNNLTDQDHVLTPAKKYVRKRGIIDYLRGENGKYLKDKNGNRVPKIASGDSIRGLLHKETFYGKIRIAAKDENGSLLRDENGNIQYAQERGKATYKMVERKSIGKVNFNTDEIIDKYIAEHLKKQLESGIKQNELKDFQGNIVRHLRCEVKSGRGTMKPENATIVKEHIYKSNKEYKNYYYANSGDNYMFGLYENEFGRQIISINLFETTQLSLDVNKESLNDIFKSKEPVFIKKGKKQTEAQLIHIFQPGQKVIFFFENKEELKDLEKNNLSKRLYFIKTLHQSSVGNIKFQHHLEARSEDELSKIYGTKGKDGFPLNQLTENFSPPRMLFKPIKDNFIIEGKDFDMKLDGTINFKF